ncbi:unnamed protein product [Caenorhabditis angaria]|uniref:G-protein coupled receptors family 1 profile domain-containing protein n=1 Tax=Caenorhabditis angaria TaxID=860376 RepID=A0A9P1J405_9PELO|nr:unnamed protein product [Caenorhabditis angaria]
MENSTFDFNNGTDITGQFVELNFSYTVELWMYGIAFCFGVPSFIFTVQRIIRTSRKNLILAARLFSYKISLTVADSIILFIYAPVQFLWIRSYFWFGGDWGCTMFKFISTFGFHLTANMQVLVAVDRLLITAKMNRVNRNMKKRQYNTRLCLAAAWILALICACPQIFIFRERMSPDMKKQCISIFTENLMEYYDQLAMIEQYNAEVAYNEIIWKNYTLTNNTEMLNLLIDPQVPEISNSKMVENRMKWRTIETTYNSIHLATISVLPFLIVLICYTMILYILKGAMKGKFVSLNDIFKQLFCCWFGNQRITSPSESNMTQESENLVSGRTKLVRTISSDKRRSASIDLPNSPRNGSCVSVSLNENGSPTVSIHPAGHIVQIRPLGFFQRILQCILPSFIYRSTPEGSVPLHSVSYESNSGRRTSEPPRSNTMWVNTVDTARRNARWKAFMMISLNLFFWAPYVIIALISVLVETSDGNSFLMNLQFVNSILTFNAISNILL